MSIVLKHTAYSGFFPFFLTPYAGESASDPTTLLSSALADLVQLFWSAKDALISYDLSYSATRTGPAEIIQGGTATTVYNSTLIGSFRASSDVNNYANYSLMALPPPSRVGPVLNGTQIGLYPLIYSDATYLTSLNEGPVAQGSAVTTYASDPPHDPDSTSYGPVFNNPNISWFGSLNTVLSAFANVGGGGNVAYDSVANKYYTRFAFTGGNLGYISLTSSSHDEFGGAYSAAPGVTLDIQNRGRSIFSGPLSPFYYYNIPASDLPASVSGPIVINFDTFWT